MGVEDRVQDRQYQLNFDQLGRAHRRVHIADWRRYLEAEKEEFWKRYSDQVHVTAGVNDFTFIKLLGHGMFGKVLLIKHRETQIYHAVKIIKKIRITRQIHKRHFINEKRILMSVRFPFAIWLDYYMQDSLRHFLVMPVALGGELFGYIQAVGQLTEEVAKFYMAQVVLVIEYLHNMGIIYRDLKPENILIDHTGYIKLSDFGFSKVSARTYTICGTPEYIAPEVLSNRGYGQSVDWWSTGVFIYDLICGQSPFKAKQMNVLLKKIVDCDYKFPKYISDSAKNLITNLLQVDTTKRFGCMKPGVSNIKNHRWFKSIVWLDVLNKRVPPPYVPKLTSIEDISNFTKGKEGIDVQRSFVGLFSFSASNERIETIAPRMPYV